jgi:hypothetical protein
VAIRQLDARFWRRRLSYHLTCPKTILDFTADEGADAHCQVGAERLALARIYNRLDDTLDAVSPRRHGLVHSDKEGL